MNLLIACLRLGGSLKAKGFGDGRSDGSHPQAALEAATLLPSIHKFNFHGELKRPSFPVRSPDESIGFGAADGLEVLGVPGEFLARSQRHVA